MYPIELMGTLVAKEKEDDEIKKDDKAVKDSSVQPKKEFAIDVSKNEVGDIPEEYGGIGVINITKDHDDIVRSVMPVMQDFLDAENATLHFCLGLEAAILYRGGITDVDFPQADTILFSRVEENTTEEVLRLNTSEGKLLIDYIGGSYSYPMLSLADILQGNYQPQDIEGKVIFIGTTLLTSHDCYITPCRTPHSKYYAYFKELLPQAELPKVVSTFGVEIHAHIFQTIVEHSSIWKLNRWWSIFSILVVGSLSGPLFFRTRHFLLNTLILLLTGGFVWGIAQYSFSIWNLWIELTPLLVILILNYVVGLGFQHSVTFYNQNQVKRLFQQYVSAAVVEEMLKHPEKVQLGGERKFLTVLFSDIRGFTPLSEGMEPQKLAQFLNEYLSAMTHIILKYDGTLDKYVGDEIMALYGAPVEQHDHAARACETALDMMNTLKELQQRWRSQGKPVITIGIGINSGTMSVGNMGSDTRFDYTVTGDRVNLGARLESTNKLYGTNILLSEYTRQELHNNSQTPPFVVRELDLVRVKGKKEPVRIYELIGRTGEVDKATLQRIDYFGQGLTAYRNRQWEEAIECFKQSLSLELADIPSQLYIQRCLTYQIDPPGESWDGVYTMTSK